MAAVPEERAVRMPPPPTIYDAYPHHVVDALDLAATNHLGASVLAQSRRAPESDLNASRLGRSSADHSLLDTSDRLSASMCSRFGKFHGDVFETNERASVLSVLKRRRRALASKSRHRVLRAAVTFTTEDVLRSGLLTKQGSWRHNWKTRFFLLRKDVPSLCYYKSEENLTLLGAIPITSDTIIVDKSAKAQAPFRFQIRTEDASLLLETDSRGNQMRWIDAIVQLADALRARQFRRSRNTNSSGLNASSLSTITASTSVTSSAINNGTALSRILSTTESQRCRPSPVGASDFETDSNALDMDALAGSDMSSSEDEDETDGDDDNLGSNRAPPTRAGRNSLHLSDLMASGNADPTAAPAKSTRGPRHHHGGHVSRLHDLVLRLQCGRDMKALMREPPSLEHAGFFVQVDGTARGQSMQLGVTDVIKLSSSTSPNTMVPFTIVLTLDLARFETLQVTLFKCSLQQGPGYSQTCVGGGTVPVNKAFLYRGETRRVSVAPFVPERSMRKEPEDGLAIVVHAFSSISPQTVLPTSGIDMATTKYILPIASGNNNTDEHLDKSSTSTQASPKLVAVDEILRVPRSTYALPLAILEHLERSLSRRIGELEIRAARVGSDDTLTAYELETCKLQLQSNLEQQHFLKQQQTRLFVEEKSGHVFRSVSAQVDRPRADDEPDLQPPFKKSTLKSEPLWQMLPTNMQDQFLCVPPAPDVPVVWHTMTMGCPSAHTKGFTSGSGRQLTDGDEGQDNTECSITEEDVLTASSSGHSHRGLSRRPPSDNPMTALKRRLQQEERLAIVGSQILSAVVACMIASIELAALGSRYHILQLEQAAKLGYLVQFESLLSTQGKELGMLEDFATGAQWLRRVSVRFCEQDATGEYFTIEATENGMTVSTPNLSASSIGSMSFDDEPSVIVTIGLRRTHMRALPARLADGHACRIRCVLFTQGVNEKQTLMHAIKGNSVKAQERVNRDNFLELQKIFEQFCRYHGYDLTQSTRRRSPPISRLTFQALEDLLAQIEQHLSSSTAHYKKNVALLLATADFCRALGAARVTCCKSGKDRTAMSVTLEQARMCCHSLDALDVKRICANMRIFGVRRKNVLLNTRSTKFAFNEVQRKLLPDCYQPPTRTYRSGKS